MPDLAPGRAPAAAGAGGCCSTVAPECGECRVRTDLARRTVLQYVALAALWVVGSDWVLERSLGDAHQLAHGSMVKGLGFVFVTGALLHSLLRYYGRCCERRTAQWREARREAQLTASQLDDERARAAAGDIAREGVESQLRMMLRAVEQSPLSIVITDHAGLIEYVNPGFTALTGYTLEEVKGRSPRVLKSGETKPGEYRLLWETITSGREWRGEFRNRKKNGELFWESASISPITDRSGRITHFLAVKEDITARKEAARALRESEEMYRTLVSASPDPIVVLNAAGKVDFISPRAREVFGYAAEDDLVGRDLSDSVAPADRARAAESFAAALGQTDASAPEEFTLRRGDGTEFFAEVSGAPLRSTEGEVKGLVVIARDITERKRAAAQLHVSEERFRQVVETIAEVFWIFDPALQQIVYVSPNFEKIWGRKSADAVDMRRVWLESLHPEDRDRIAAIMRAPNPEAGADQTYRIFRPDGSVRWIRDRAFQVYDAAGQVVRIVGVAEDISERKDIERQFLRAQRLEAIGTLASGVAHDMNNILAPMMIVPGLLKERLTQPADRQLLGIVEQSAQRGSGIVRQLLTFSRGAEGQRGPVKVTHLTKEMLGIMRETFPREITVESNIARELPMVHCDPTQIHQVLMNLCVNARDAMPQGGVLTLGVQVAVLDEHAGRLHHAARPGHYVLLTVRDTGHGMPPEIIERIFDPFFTTKEPGKGTGLGLSTVLGIVVGHGGFVLVESEVNRGSTFKVYLPAAEMPPPAASAVSQSPFPRGGGEVILVVDDEEPIREATRQLLQGQGYRVVTAANGREALARFDATVRLVITDMMMPTMNGMALIRALRGIAPAIEIVASTGMQESVQQETLNALGVAEILWKPWRANDLLAIVRRTIKPAAGTS